MQKTSENKNTLFFIVHFVYAAILFTSLSALSAERCENIFVPTPGSSENLLEAALTKAHRHDDLKGLSDSDLKILTQKIFAKEHGQKLRVSDYWEKNSEQRTLGLLAREVGEEVAHKGLISYFQDHGILVDNNLISTKISLFLQSRTMQLVHVASALAISIHGAPPLSLPDFAFKIDPLDMETLLRKGLDSPEGRVLATRYGLQQEVLRGYSLFNRYYSRVALVVLMYIVYEQTQDKLKKRHQQESDKAYDQMMEQMRKQFGGDKPIESKQDILFATVMTNFYKKYSRLPTAEEKSLICLNIYNWTCTQ